MNTDVYRYIAEMEEDEFIAMFETIVYHHDFRDVLANGRDMNLIAKVESLFEDATVPTKYHDTPSKVEALVNAVAQRFINIDPARFAYLAFVSER